MPGLFLTGNRDVPMLLGREFQQSKALVPVTFSLCSVNTTAANTRDPGRVRVCATQRRERRRRNTSGANQLTSLENWRFHTARSLLVAGLNPAVLRAGRSSAMMAVLS